MAQIKDSRFIADNAIDDLDIRLRNDEPLRGRNVADSGDVNLIRVNSNDKVQLADTDNSIVLPTRSTDPTPTDAGEMWFNSTTGAAKIYDGAVIKTVFQSTEVSDFTFDSVTNAGSPYNLTVGTDILEVDTSGGAVTINLPAAASSTGKRFKIIKTSSDFTAVTIDANASETINGSTTTTINTQYEFIELFCNGTSWLLFRTIPEVGGSYTPTTQGFGTISSVNMNWQRHRSHIRIYGRFTAGTATAVEAQIGLPSPLSILSTINEYDVANGTNHHGLTSSAGWPNDFVCLMTGGDTFLNIKTDGSGGLSPDTGSGISATGAILVFNVFVPIQGWQN